MANPNAQELKLRRGYWYLIYLEECPACFWHTEWRERVYNTPRPEKWEDRHIRTQVLCDRCRYE